MKCIVQTVRIVILLPFLLVIAAYHIYVKGELKDEE